MAHMHPPASAGTPPPDPAVVGTWGRQDPGSPFLEFHEDGALTGSDGCNRLRGTWSGTGEALVLPLLASTRMACPGTDTWLSGGASAVVEGDLLVVSDTQGTVIGALRRAGDAV